MTTARVPNCVSESPVGEAPPERKSLGMCVATLATVILPFLGLVAGVVFL
jgi:hypothetical protein